MYGWLFVFPFCIQRQTFCTPALYAKADFCIPALYVETVDFKKNSYCIRTGFFYIPVLF